jgi:hypothetical protein
VGVAGGVAGRPAGRTQTPAVHTMMLFLGGPYILKFHRIFVITKQIFHVKVLIKRIHASFVWLLLK